MGIAKFAAVTFISLAVLFQTNIIVLLAADAHDIDTPTESRYLHNYTLASGQHEDAKNETIGGFIHGQANTPQSLLRVGEFGNGYQNGCGPIALHNALFSLYMAGKLQEEPCIADIIHRLDTIAGFVLGGELGTNPHAAVEVLRQFIPSSVRYLPSTIDEAVRRSAAGSAVLLYAGQSAPGRPVYWHYVMIRDVGQAFEIYNADSHDTEFQTVSSMDEWFKGRLVLALITFH